MTMWKNYYHLTSLDEAVTMLERYGAQARIVAGATDLMLELERGQRPGVETLLDISRIPGLEAIWLDEQDIVHLGALATHNDCVASPLLQANALPLVQAAGEVGAPQIRNRATVAGNLITASPANDTITPLMALGAKVKLRSAGGERWVALNEFYTGVRRTVMQPDELLTEIAFPALKPTQRGAFIKIGLRRAQAIAVVNAAVVLDFDGEQVRRATITLGAVAPTIVFARAAEEFLPGRKLDEATIAEAAKLAQQAARPIDDVRGSAAYRVELVRVAVLRLLRTLAEAHAETQNDEARVLLRAPGTGMQVEAQSHEGKPEMGAQAVRTYTPGQIVTRINGRDYVFSGGQEKSLLRLLREDAGLVGSKEGCAEGECGACTVFLDGAAVMSCLVPAPRAHGAEILTIEGLSAAEAGALHPLQQAFLETGAVQCGYCTPGFVMSGAMLLEEVPQPSRQQVQQAFSGNLCRCTGYYKIIEAVELAAQRLAQAES